MHMQTRHPVGFLPRLPSGLFVPHVTPGSGQETFISRGKLMVLLFKEAHARSKMRCHP